MAKYSKPFSKQNNYSSKMTKYSQLHPLALNSTNYKSNAIAVVSKYTNQRQAKFVRVSAAPLSRLNALENRVSHFGQIPLKVERREAWLYCFSRRASVTRAVLGMSWWYCCCFRILVCTTLSLHECPNVCPAKILNRCLALSLFCFSYKAERIRHFEIYTCSLWELYKVPDMFNGRSTNFTLTHLVAENLPSDWVRKSQIIFLFKKYVFLWYKINRKQLLSFYFY